MITIWLQLIVCVFTKYEDGRYLFTEQVDGTCDYQYSNSYIYDYNALGGDSIDSMLAAGFGFWMKYITTNAAWTQGVSEYSYAFVLTNNTKSMDLRLLSFGLKKQGTDTIIQVYQKDSTTQGPTLQVTLAPSLNFDDMWNFIYVSYDFSFMRYNLGIYRDGITVLATSKSCPSGLLFCGTSILPQPFLKRPNLQLKVGLHAPYNDQTTKGRTLCGSIASFQFYPDVTVISTDNLFSLMYGHNIQSRYAEFRLNSYTGLVAHNYASNYHGSIVGTTTWAEQSLEVASPLKVTLPGVRLSEYANGGRYVVAFWVKANPTVTFAVLQKTENSILVFELKMVWFALSNYYFFRISNQFETYDSNVQFTADVWHHFIFVFNYKSHVTSTTAKAIVIVYKNYDAPVTLTTNINAFSIEADSNQFSIGNSESIPAGKILKLSNMIISQGGRILMHTGTDVPSDGCRISVPIMNKLICLICESGKYLMNLDGKTTCVPVGDCATNNFTPDSNRFMCLPKCSPTCKTCGIGTPDVCLTCMNNLVLNAGVCKCMTTGYLGTPGTTLQCEESMNLVGSQIGYADAAFTIISAGSSARQETKFITFAKPFLQTPQVLLSINSIRITQGSEFRILPISITKTTFTLQVQVWADTLITNLRVMYLASTESDQYRVQQLDIDTSATLGVGTGDRSHVSTILYSPWNLDFKKPKFIPFLLGFQRTSGAQNITLEYDVQLLSTVQFTIKTTGDGIFSKVYYNYLMIPEYVESANILHRASEVFLQVSQVGITKQNITHYTFIADQDDNFYGLTSIGFGTTMKSISLTERRANSKMFAISLSALESTQLPLYGYSVVSLRAACQSMGCATCTNSPATCNSCKSPARSVGSFCLNCASNQYLDAKYDCTDCAYYCFKCEQAANLCTVCPSSMNRVDDIVAKCPCATGYFDNGAATCAACDWRCESCVTDQYSCTSCRGSSRDVDIQCKCKPKFFESGIDVVCKNCVEPCDECDTTGCLTCMGNMVVTTSNKCACPTDGVGITDTWFCETCDSAQMLATLSQDTETIYVKFLIEATEFYLPEYSKLNKIKLCQLIITTDQYPRFGYNPQCVYNSTGILIYLGEDALLSQMESLLFNPMIFKKLNCTVAIKNYWLTELQLSEVSNLPEFNIQGPIGEIFICRQITLELVKVKYAGRRKLAKVEWSLDTVLTDFNLKDRIQEILDLANSENLYTVTFEELLFPKFQNFTFSVNAMSFLTQWNVRQYTLQIIGNIQPYLASNRTTIRQNYKEQLIIPVWAYYEVCNDGQIFQYSTSMTLAWNEVDKYPNTSNSIMQYQQQVTIEKVEQYLILSQESGQPDTTYIIQATLKYSEPPKTTTIPVVDTPVVDTPVVDTPTITQDVTIHVNFTVVVEYVGLTVILQGGDRIVAQGESQEFYALSWDGVQPGYFYNSDPDIHLMWKCTQQLNDMPCQAADGTPIEFNQDATAQLIDGSAFKLGQTYIMEVTATKDIRSVTHKIQIVCTFKTIVPLFPEYSIAIQSRDININQPITFYFPPTNGTIEDYQYSCNIIYDGQSTAMKTLKYPQITFRLIDLLPLYLYTTSLTIQLISKSEQTHKIASLPIIINTPPQGAILVTSVEKGIALETEYTITVQSANDEDLPILYRLSIYLSQSHYKFDVINGVDTNQIVLTQYQLSPTFITRLPSGITLNGETSSETYIMVTLKDCRGATSNVSTSMESTKLSRLWSGFAYKIQDIYNIIASLTTPYDKMVAALEMILFYKEYTTQNATIENFTQYIIKQQKVIETLQLTDLDQQRATQKVLQLFNSSLLRIQLADDQYSNYTGQIEYINNSTAILSQNLSKYLTLKDEREDFGILSSQNNIYFTYQQIMAQFNEYNILQNYIIDSKRLKELDDNLVVTTMKQWRLNNPDEALKMDADESDENKDELTIPERLQIYNEVKEYINILTVQETVELANYTLDILTEVNKYFIHSLTQVELLAKSILQLLQLNEGPFQINGTYADIQIEYITYPLMVQKFLAKSQNLTNSQVLNNRILEEKTLNKSKLYYTAILTYHTNPYMATEEFFKYSGAYSFDRTFPVYNPIIYEQQDNGTLLKVTQPTGFNFSIDFLVPNTTAKLLSQYTCGQKITGWAGNMSNCSRTVEYVQDIYQFKLWCTCPYFSETTLIRMFKVKDQPLKNVKVFEFSTFLEFRIGHMLIGMTGAFILFALLGFLLDKKENTRLKELQEELEQQKVEATGYNRKRKVHREDDEEKQNLNTKVEVQMDEIGTQTEAQPIENHRDIGLKDFSVGLLITGIIKLQEILSILIYYDSHTLRTVRFLAIYMKMLVMMSLSGLLWNQSDLYQSYGVTLAFSELSTLIVKVIKAQLSGRGLQIVVGVIVSLGILTLAMYDIFIRSFGQEESPLENWMIFYGICVGANYFVLDPLLCLLKIILYPWCVKQMETNHETPILYLIYFLITQEDLKSFYKREL